MRLWLLPAATLVFTMLASAVSVSAQSHGPLIPHQLVLEAEDALQAQRYSDAFQLFSEAAGMLRHDPSLCVSAAVAASMTGRHADAEAWFNRALQLSPSYTHASLLLGQLLYRQGRISEAVRVYDDASRYAPAEPQMAKRLEQWRAEATLQSRFYEVRDAHVAVLFENATDDLLARKVVALLEEAYSRIGFTLSSYPSETITAVLYTPEQFKSLTRSPSWANGAFDGRITLPAAGKQEPDEETRRTLEHELVHALVTSIAGPSVPTWLQEGLAGLLEPGGLERADGVLARTPARLPMARLTGTFSGLDADEASLAYAQSAAAVRQIVEQRGMSAVVALIQALGQGTPFDSAFQQALQMRIDEFESLAVR